MKKTIAIIIKHPGRDFDYRVDLVQIDENTSFEEAIKAHEQKMLGPFQIIGFTEKVSNTQFIPAEVTFREAALKGNIDTSMHIMD